MKTQIDQFRVSDNAQDRIKLPRVFWAGLKAIGLTAGAVLRQSNLPPTVYGGESLIASAQMFSIWQAIRELSKDPTVGWKFMSKVETDQYHPTLLAALHARTYRESIDATPAQIALAWLLAQKPWIVSIPGTRNLNHLNENLGAINVELTPAELREIDTALLKIKVHGGRMNEMQMKVVE